MAQQQWTVEDVADSYALWWREAGLHSATSLDAHGWRAEPAAAIAEAPPPVLAPAAPALAAPIPVATALAMPHELGAFRRWLAEDGAQPEASWGSGALFLPPETAGARLLLLCEMPDDGADNPALPFEPVRARFIAAMLASIGLAIGDVAFAPLAMRRPPGGLLDDATFAALANRMRRYLSLAQPRAALILGDRTNRALIAAEGSQAPGRLPEINHEAGKLTAAALASPEHLMRRPAAKAASWQTLRLLHGVLN